MKRKTKFQYVLWILLIGISLNACQQAGEQNAKNDKKFKALSANTEFDLVILNGRVMDPETNFDGIRNVGIKDGIIGLITEKDIKGKETIDATAHAVVPGFIDVHQHCVDPYIYRLMVRDGRTTIMDLESGAYGPKVGEWYKAREGKAPINFGVSSSHEFARASVLDGFKDWKFFNTPDALASRVKQGWSKTRPTLEQGNQILTGSARGTGRIAPTDGCDREAADRPRDPGRFGRPRHR